jgi:hypothetical protein
MCSPPGMATATIYQTLEKTCKADYSMNRNCDNKLCELCYDS